MTAGVGGGRCSPHGDSGMVTAEIAAALPALVVVIAAALWVVTAAAASLRCQDAAYEAARALARGETSQAAAQVAAQIAPTGASVRLSRSAAEARADVDVAVVLGVGPLRAASVTVHRDAAVPREDGAGGDPAPPGAAGAGRP